MTNWGTTARTIRIADELWNAAKEKAATENTTVSEWIRARLEEWIRE